MEEAEASVKAAAVVEEVAVEAAPGEVVEAEAAVVEVCQQYQLNN